MNEISEKLSTSDQEGIEFPDCSKRCDILTVLGAGECDSVCPWKFDKDGEPLDQSDFTLYRSPFSSLCPASGVGRHNY